MTENERNVNKLIIFSLQHFPSTHTICSVSNDYHLSLNVSLNTICLVPRETLSVIFHSIFISPMMQHIGKTNYIFYQEHQFSIILKWPQVSENFRIRSSCRQTSCLCFIRVSLRQSSRWPVKSNLYLTYSDTSFLKLVHISLLTVDLMPFGTQSPNVIQILIT